MRFKYTVNLIAAVCAVGMAGVGRAESATEAIETATQALEAARESFRAAVAEQDSFRRVNIGQLQEALRTFQTEMQVSSNFFSDMSAIAAATERRNNSSVSDSSAATTLGSLTGTPERAPKKPRKLVASGGLLPR